ncbi:hypothetical protein EBX31_12925, partial [bacterium]|nr:hypothetical protein [bacterium]
MASIWKPPGTKNWCARFRGPDGIWRNKSAGTPDKTAAMKFAAELELFSKQNITKEKLRRTLETLAEIATGAPVTKFTIDSWLSHWLENKQRSCSAGTCIAYTATVTSFREFLGPDKLRRGLDFVEPSLIQQWLKTIEREVTPVTARNHLKRLTGAFAEATRNRFIEHNPCISVSSPKDRNPPEKPGFTTRQIEALLKAADNEWRGVIFAGFYLALRLGDAVSLRWKNIDLGLGWISVTPEKTRHLGKRARIPIHPTFRDYLISLGGQDDPESFIFPNLAKKKVPGQSGLSRRFSEIVEKAGIENSLLRPESSVL